MAPRQQQKHLPPHFPARVSSLFSPRGSPPLTDRNYHATVAAVYHATPVIWLLFQAAHHAGAEFL
jgi:hypothetical protein